VPRRNSTQTVEDRVSRVTPSDDRMYPGWSRPSSVDSMRVESHIAAGVSEAELMLIVVAQLCGLIVCALRCCAGSGLLSAVEVDPVRPPALRAH
jgi:hypothetical protein